MFKYRQLTNEINSPYALWSCKHYTCIYKIVVLIQNYRKQEDGQVPGQCVTAAQLHSVQKNPWKLNYVLPFSNRRKKAHVLAHLLLVETHSWKSVIFHFMKFKCKETFFLTNLNNLTKVFMYLLSIKMPVLTCKLMFSGGLTLNK